VRGYVIKYFHLPTVHYSCHGGALNHSRGGMKTHVECHAAQEINGMHTNNMQHFHPWDRSSPSAPILMGENFRELDTGYRYIHESTSP
jgi:hypothetical protein